MRAKPAISSIGFRKFGILFYQQCPIAVFLASLVLLLFRRQHSQIEGYTSSSFTSLSFQIHYRNQFKQWLSSPSSITHKQIQPQGISSNKLPSNNIVCPSVKPICLVNNPSSEVTHHSSEFDLLQNDFSHNIISSLSPFVIDDEEEYDKDVIGSRRERILEFVNSYLSSLPESTLSFTEIENRIEQEHLQDYKIAQQSYLVIENRTKSITTESLSSSVPSYQWVDEQGRRTKKQQSIAIQSTEPILDQRIVQDIRNAAEIFWNDNASKNSTTTSRFTYQFVGNSEVHLSDLVQKDIDLRHRINEAIESKIYPLVRSAFLQSSSQTTDNEKKSNPNEQLKLFIYDSLVIRYNATAAAAAAVAAAAGATSGFSNNTTVPINNTTINNKVGAGQPLHRDLGIISVNVMLNNNFNEFVGGGTYFENQYTSIIQEPIKPLGGCGHCIAHLSSQRHAGAVTTAGVRDILVFFISGIMIPNSDNPTDSTNERSHTTENELKAWNTADKSINKYYAVPPAIQIAKLKQCRDYCENRCQVLSNDTEEQRIICSFDCRLRHYALAINNNPILVDGEAYQYLGTTFMEYAKFVKRISQQPQQQRISSLPGPVPTTANLLQRAIDCFLVASTLTPNDARIYNNLGIVLERYCNEIVNDASSTDIIILKNAIESTYKKAYTLLVTQHDAGCNVDTDFDSVSLNYGAFLANQDRFEESIVILDRLAFKHQQQQQHLKASQPQQPTSTNSKKNTRLLEDAYKLWFFCQKQVNKKKIER